MPVKLGQNIAKAFEAASARFSSLSQKEGRRTADRRAVTPGMPELLRRAAAQGAVLLKNDGALPLGRGETISLFGRVQRDWFYTGYGSGGDVNKPYAVNLLEGVRNCGVLRLNEELAAIYEAWCERNPVHHGVWGRWPRCYPEMQLAPELVGRAAEVSQVAIVVIGRSSGEDRENALEQGSFYLTEAEERMLSLVTARFDKTVVLLNIGSVMDLSWIEAYEDRISAALVVWQGGMESGNAAADLLCGAQTPCGRLTDTIARSYESYPSSTNFGNKEYNCYEEDVYVGYRWFETFRQQDVLYPFGYGLSYTSFSVAFEGAEQEEDGFLVRCMAANTGARFAGRETVQLYLEKPCGVLGNPFRVLAGFAKTKLLAPGEEQCLSIFVPMERLSSYDDSGKTGFRSAYVVEKGVYGFALGGNVRDAQRVWAYEQPETVVLEQLREVAAPVEAFQVIAARVEDGIRYPVREPVHTRTTQLRQIILDALPQGQQITGDQGYRLSDVKEGRVTMDAFVAQLNLKELEAITRGAYTMNSPLGASGNAGVFAGVLPSLRKKGIPPVTTTDGPSGIRLKSTCSLLPIGTLLACTFDESLVREVYAALGREMREKGSDVLLAPGMNIHRNPLCGRNFEYYSEDPFLTGKIAAAAVKGLQSTGVSACPKHFACNNQEYCRNVNDSRLSERALREIYLKGFEICVKEAKPQNIMTSYNKINGVWGHYQYELCTMILRREWGYEGCVMTDWWMKPSHSPEFPSLRDNGYRVRAQVDVLMPGGKRAGLKISDGTLLETYGKINGMTLGELQRSAKNVLRFAMQSAAMERFSERKAKRK